MPRSSAGTNPVVRAAPIPLNPLTVPLTGRHVPLSATPPPWSRPEHYAFRMLVSFLAVLTLAAVGLTLGAPCTSFGWLAVATLVLGLASQVVRPPWRARVWRACLVAAVFSAGGCLRDANLRHARTARVSHGAARAPSLAGPSASGARSTDTPKIEPTFTLSGAIADEEILALLGARMAVASHRIPATEAAGLLSVMKDGYRRMKEADGRVPTPVVRWMAGAAPETLLIEPDDSAAPSAAVVFLHGWGGSWSLPCWQVALAARRVGALTVCPATRFEGDWWSEQGQSTVRATLEALRADRSTPVVLVGLSNGGIGASLLAPALAQDIVGLVLISGASPEAGKSGVPTLVLHGAHDTMVSPQSAREYCRRTGASYRSVDGTHFVLLEKHEQMTDAIEAFLRSVLAGTARGQRMPLTGGTAR